jgi:subtilase family serine protease
MTNKGVSYVSEMVWNHSLYIKAGPWDNGQTTNDPYWGSGGGVSTTYPIPPWQQSVNMTAVGERWIKC